MRTRFVGILLALFVGILTAGAGPAQPIKVGGRDLGGGTVGVETFDRPELPRLFVDVSFLPPSGNTIRVDAGGNFQRALNKATCGDTIMLEAGATFIGNFKLPNKDCTGLIVIRSSADDSNLPAEEERITPAFAPFLPKILSNNSSPAIRTEKGAHDFRLIGLEIGVTADVYKLWNLIQLGSGGKTTADLPHDIVIDRCFVHGNDTGGIRRGIVLNGATMAVINSHVSNFHEVGADSQAILGYNGPGPFKIVNNYLEGAGENVMFGGADARIKNLVPSDIEIRRNHFFKPLSWRKDDPSYAGKPWAVKNLFELKNARRVLVEGNVFENSWVSLAAG